MPAVIEHPGLKLDAVQNADGTWNVLDVPILPPVEKGVKNAPEDIGPDWMERAVQFAATEAENGHLGSLHVHHHGLDRPEYAGKILPRRVGATTVEGQVVPCVFADFLFVPEAILSRIETHELSYCSPEVYDWNKTRIDTVALLSTEPPHHRKPMLGIGRRIPNTTANVSSYGDPAAFHAAMFSARTPYRFSEDFPMSDAPDKKPDDEKPDKPDKAELSDEGSGIDAASVIKAIESGDIPVKDFEAIIAAIDARGGGTPAEEPEDEVMDEVTPVQMQASKDPELAAQLRAQANRLDAIEKRDKVREMVETEVTKLQAENFEVRKGDIDDLTHFANQSPEDFAKFSAAFRRLNPKKSSETLLEAETRARQKDSPEVAKFQAQGPEALSQAREIAAGYPQYTQRGGRASLEQYIEINMAAESPAVGR